MTPFGQRNSAMTMEGDGGERPEIRHIYRAAAFTLDF